VYSLLASYGSDFPPLTPGLPVTAALSGGALTYFSYDVPAWVPQTGPNASFATDPSFFFDAVLTSLGGGGGSYRASLQQAAASPLVVAVSNVVNPATGNTLPPVCTGGANNATCDGVHFANAVWVASGAAAPGGGSSASVSVSSASAAFTNGTQYVIGVYSAVDATATVLAADAASLAQLPAGVPVPVTLPGGACAFFRLSFVGPAAGASGADTDVELALTLTAGDAALFASISPALTRPTGAVHDYAAAGEGGASPGVVVIPWGDIAARGAAGTPGSPCASGSGLCTVYASVCGTGAAAGAVAEATLTGLAVNISSVQTVALGDGVPAAGFVPPGQARYYSVALNASGLPFYSFVLQRSAGGPRPPHLYLRLSNGVPGPAVYDATTAGTGRPYITLSAAGGGPFCAAAACTLTVAVVAAPGSASGTAFTLTFLAAGTPAVLVPGLPFREGLPRGASRRYVLAFPTDDASGAVRFAVASPGGPPVSYYLLPWASGTGGSGSPSTLPPPMPAPGPGAASCVNLTSVTAGVLAVTAQTPATATGCWCTFCHQVLAAACPAAGTGDGTACDVTVAGTVAAPGDGVPAITTLTAGQPVVGAALTSRDASFFSFSLAHLVAPGGGLAAAVGVAVTSDSGPTPALYATNAYIRGVSPQSALPASRAARPLWSDAGSLLPGTLVIPAGDPAFAPAVCAARNCTDVTLGVVGASAASAYRVVFFAVDAPGSSGGGGAPATNASTVPTVTRLDLGRPSGTVGVPSGVARLLAFTLPAGFTPAVAAAAGATVTVTATGLDGAYALAVGAGAPPAGCSGVGPAVTCGGAWVSLPATSGTGSGGPIVIAAAAPCAPSGGATAACNTSTAWNPGAPYYVSLYGAGPPNASSLVALTAALSSATAPGVITLLDGVPVAAPGVLPPPAPAVPVTGLPAPLPPAFAFASQHDPLAAPPVVFTVTKSAPFRGVLTVSIGSCVVGRCGAGAWWPSIARGTGAVSDAISPFMNGTTITLDTASVAGYCRDGGLALGLPGAPCAYFLVVEPACVDGNGTPIGAPSSPTVCTPASFTVAASTPGADGAPVAIPAAQSADGAFASLEGALTPAVNYSYQALLAPGAGRLTVVLETSGPAGAAAYFCDPTLAAGAPGGCVDAFAPSSSDYTYALRTADGSGPTGAPDGGRSVLSVAGLASQGVYFTLALDSGSGANATTHLSLRGVSAHRRLAGGASVPPTTLSPPAAAVDGASGELFTGTVCGDVAPRAPTCARYRLLLAAGADAVLLAPPRAPLANVSVLGFGTNNASGAATVPVTLAWPPYVMAAVDPRTPVPAPPHQGVVYRVYAAAGGFAAAGTGAVPTTALGLEAWAAAAADVSATFTTPPLFGAQAAAPSLVVPLLGNTSYDVAVVAVCDAACWKASRIDRGSTTQALLGLPVATFAVPAAGPGPVGPSASPSTGASPSPTPAGPGGPGGSGGGVPLGAAIGGGVGGALALVLVAAGLFVLHRRRRAGSIAPGGTGPTVVVVVKAAGTPNRFSAGAAGGIATPSTTVAAPDWGNTGGGAVATLNPAAAVAGQPPAPPAP
jgi:hypothetical protein